MSLLASVVSEQTPFSSLSSTGLVHWQDEILTAEIDSFIQDTLSEWNSPGGVSVAMVRKTIDGSWNIETKGYGIATEDGSRVTADTLFCIASNSKESAPSSSDLLT